MQMMPDIIPYFARVYKLSDFEVSLMNVMPRVLGSGENWMLDVHHRRIRSVKQDKIQDGMSHYGTNVFILPTRLSSNILLPPVTSNW
jgi:hypothetical protein